MGGRLGRPPRVSGWRRLPARPTSLWLFGQTLPSVSLRSPSPPTPRGQDWPDPTWAAHVALPNPTNPDPLRWALWSGPLTHLPITHPPSPHSSTCPCFILPSTQPATHTPPIHPSTHPPVLPILHPPAHPLSSTPPISPGICPSIHRPFLLQPPPSTPTALTPPPALPPSRAPVLLKHNPL